MMRHVVLWKWRDAADSDEIDTVLSSLDALAGKVPGLLAVHSGRNSSQSAAARGNTHWSVLQFRDSAAFDAWHSDPQYQAWSASARPIIDQPTVLDIEGDFPI